MFLSLGGSRRSNARNKTHRHGNAVHAVRRRLYDRLQRALPPPPPQDLDPLRRYYALGASSPFPAYRNNLTTFTSFSNYPDPTLTLTSPGYGFQSSFTTALSSPASSSPWSLPSFVSSTSPPSTVEQALVDSREYCYSPESVVHQHTRRSHIQADQVEGGVWRMHPHSLADGISRSNSCCWGGEYSKTIAPRVRNHDHGAVIAMNSTSGSGGNGGPLESTMATTPARPERNMLSWSPQQSTHVAQTSRDSFSNSNFCSGSVSDLLAGTPQYAWDATTTTSNNNNNTLSFPFETCSLEPNYTRPEADMTGNQVNLRPPSDECFEISQLAKRLFEDEDDGVELGLMAQTSFKRPCVRPSGWNDDDGTFTPRSEFDYDMAALAATERVLSYELVPSFDIASSAIERFDHEEL